MHESQDSAQVKMDSWTHERFLETFHSDCDGRTDVRKALVICARLVSSRPLTGSMNTPRRDETSQLVTSHSTGVDVVLHGADDGGARAILRTTRVKYCEPT